MPTGTETTGNKTDETGCSHEPRRSQEARVAIINDYERLGLGHIGSLN